MQEKIGNVTLDYEYYPGEDLYSDGPVEEELLEIAKNYQEKELNQLIYERNSYIKLSFVTLPHMSICGGVITAVTFHEVHSIPHAQTGTQCHDQSLQNVHCTVEKFHSYISFALKK